MNELLASTARFLPFTLGPIFLILLAPTVTARTKTVFASLLGLGAVATVALALTSDGALRTLEIINPFIDPDRGEPVPFVVDRVTAPGWQWPAVAAAWLAFAAVWTLALRRRAPRAPNPIGYATLLSVATLAARLTLEKSAAPEPLTWALGVTMPMVLLLPFFGAWIGARGGSWKALLGSLFVLALMQRTAIVAWSFVATRFDLGTHLDVGAIREVTLPLGHRDFTAPGDQTLAQWIALAVIPQYVLWVPLTVVAGLVLGALPWRWRRARTARN